MSALNGEIIVCGQHHGDPVELVVHGDEFYARYETTDGYTVVYDTDAGAYCYAILSRGHFLSSGVCIAKPVPRGTRRHLKESAEVRNARFERRHAQLRPVEPATHSHVARTLGPADGLLAGRRVSDGNVRGLTILVNFDDVKTTTTAADVDAMLNSSNYKVNGNYCSAREYFKSVSSGKLDYTNEIVGPVQLSKRRSHYINNLLVEEALDLALVELSAKGIDLSAFDSRGERIVDALNILYAGRTQYSGDLWPHNSVERLTRNNVRTHYYLLASLGRSKVDLSIGTFCHENGHLLCRFPDMYDYGQRDGDFEKSEGIGQFCLMGSGNHNAHGRIPSPVCGYLRDLVGWVDQEVFIDSARRHEVTHSDYNTVYKYPSDQPNEYFIIENRTRQGLDGGLLDSGLGVFHCDTLGSNEWQQGTQDKHYQCALLQADGHLDLEHNRNRGDAGDLFANAEGVVLSHDTTPDSRVWDGSESGLVISDISAPGDMMQFNVGESIKAAVHRAAARPDLLIPDRNTQGIRSGIAVPKSGSIKTVVATVDITHTYVGDLTISLEPPVGTPIQLRHQQGGGTDNLADVYTEDDVTGLSNLRGESMRGVWQLHVVDGVGQDIGRLDRWGLDIEYEPAADSFEAEVAANQTIPDDNAAGIESTLSVPIDGEIENMVIGVDLVHTYIGDLHVELMAPSGHSAVLHDFEGGSRNDIHKTYDLITAPQLRGMLGQAAKGDWTLRVQDRVPADEGKLVKWSLHLDS